MAIASLIMGIVGCVFFWVPFGNILFLLVSIAGLILGCMNNDPSKHGLATAGKIVSIIALVLCLISLITCTICPSCVACSEASTYSSYYY